MRIPSLNRSVLGRVARRARLPQDRVQAASAIQEERHKDRDPHSRGEDPDNQDDGASPKRRTSRLDVRA